MLKLSYDKLPTHLKQCFTYCALFPQYYEIEKQLLVQLWIAQGYIQSLNRDEQLEDMGDRYFEESVSRLLLKKVEEDDSNDRLTYKMHDLIHNLAQSIVGYEVLIPRNATSHVSREVSHVSLLEKLNPMIKDKMEKPKRFVSLLEKLNIPAKKTIMEKKNSKGPYHGLRRFAVGLSPEIWTTVASTAHTQYSQVVEAAVRDERSMGLKSQAMHSQGQKQSGSTWVQGGSSKKLGFYKYQLKFKIVSMSI